MGVALEYPRAGFTTTNTGKLEKNNNTTGDGEGNRRGNYNGGEKPIGGERPIETTPPPMKEHVHDPGQDPSLPSRCSSPKGQTKRNSNARKEGHDTLTMMRTTEG